MACICTAQPNYCLVSTGYDHLYILLIHENIWNSKWLYGSSFIVSENLISLCNMRTEKRKQLGTQREQPPQCPSDHVESHNNLVERNLLSWAPQISRSPCQCLHIVMWENHLGTMMWGRGNSTKSTTWEFSVHKIA